MSFDVQEEGEDRPWALTDAAAASAVSLKVTDRGWKVREEALGQRVQWTLTPAADTAIKGSHKGLAQTDEHTSSTQRSKTVGSTAADRG
ncbi:MAG TPA: hypothetical protein VFU43_07625 [Streptosporangiaceae bacterium]|nr:hypothetical protein [Streptosporangiaceae bacterium]